MLVVWMVHVHYIKFTLHILLRAPPLLLATSGNIFLWFIDYPRLKIVNPLNITLVGVPSFSVGAGLVYVTSYSMKFCKETFSISNLHRWYGSAIILVSLGYVLVYFFLLLPCCCTSQYNYERVLLIGFIFLCTYHPYSFQWNNPGLILDLTIDH